MESPQPEIVEVKWLQVLLVCIVVLTVAGTVCIGGIFLSLWSGSSGPSVDSLIENYRTHRPAFTAVAQMAPRDPDFAIWNPQLSADDERYGMPTHLSAKREAQYRKLLVEIGGQSLGSGKGEIDIPLGSEGIVSAGESWGYFHTDAPQPSVDSTERARAGGGPEGWCVPLGDGWYAYLNRN